MRARIILASICRAIGLFTDADSAKVLDDCFDEVLRHGAELAIPYKEKQGDPKYYELKPIQIEIE